MELGYRPVASGEREFVEEAEARDVSEDRRAGRRGPLGQPHPGLLSSGSHFGRALKCHRAA